MTETEMYILFQYEMTSEKINEISITSAEEAYNQLYNDYITSFNALGNKPENVEDYFSWMTKKLNINIVYYQSQKQISSIIFFSKSEVLGKITTHDLSKEKLAYEILNLDVKDLVSFLIQENLLEIKPNNILEASLFNAGRPLSGVGTYLFNLEYKRNFIPQLKPSYKTLKFNTSRIHKEIYDFDAMVRVIDNKQFSLELEECLSSYEDEKFFVASAGLGSVLEHLLHLAIEKHVPGKENNIHENSTASDYIAQLKKEPFKINKRDATNLKGTFAFRNSVSHFNKGYFSKDMCDQLLNGIKICFDRYYLFIPENTKI